MTRLTPSQQQAIEARGNVLVAAGAGTGKTSTLTERCLRLLEEGCSLENVLMVTFTEAAAAEMRARIRAAIQTRVKAAENDDAAAGQREHFERQLALLDTALIGTLHSFCLRLARDSFYALGIDPDVTVLSEQQTRPLIQRTLEAVFERHYGGQTDLNRAVQRVVRLHGRGSDDRIRAVILKLHRHSQSRPDPEDWLKRQETVFNQPDPALWRKWWVESFQIARGSWLSGLAAFAGNPAVDLSMAALKAASAAPGPGEITAALHKIQAAYGDKENWPRGSVKKVRDALRDVFEEALFLASLAPRDGKDPLLEDWELVRQDMLTLLGLAREFAEEFSRAKRDAGGVDFADLEQFALRVLRDPRNNSPTPAAVEWRRQLHSVLVDEYQDINAAQDAVLSALSREGAAANRFLVGDVKQSIYRFRLGDPAIFRSYEARWRGGEAFSQRVLLADNFRSQPGILNVINPLFRALMRGTVGGVAYEDLRFGNPAGSGACADAGGTGPAVALHLIARTALQTGDEADDGAERPAILPVADLPGTEREARLVALQLREMKDRQQIWDKRENRFRPAGWSDMAVLLRSPAGRVEAYAKEFAGLGIPLEAPRGGFLESLEAMDLLCLLKVLDNPLQDVPLLAVLRSPLVGMSLSELAEIQAPETPDARAVNFWMAARRFVQRGKAASSAWRKLSGFFRQLDRWRRLVRRSSLAQGLEAVLAETQYETLLRALPRGEQQEANVRRLLALARDFDPYRRQGLFRFLRFIEQQDEIEVEPALLNRDAVKLSSIHRSKGLEFPIVAVAGLGSPFNFQDLRESILLDEAYGLCPKIRPPAGEKYYPSLPHWLAQRRQRAELLGEELRLLYVAMTRARDRLLLTATWPEKGDPKWAGGERRDLSDSEVLAARCYLDWLRLWLPQATREQEWSGDREGQSPLLSWRIYAQDDPRLVLPETAAPGQRAPPGAGLDISSLAELTGRLNRPYPYQEAVGQKAKTSVTELRGLGEDDTAEPARFIRRDAFDFPAKRGQTLSAAEIGIAHHRFLQRVSPSAVGSAEELRREADRLGREKWLSDPEKAALDFDGLAQFWRTDLGRKVAANAAAVHRELQFTARFSPTELNRLPGRDSAEAMPGPSRTGGLAEEFLVVQGVVDLAVVLPQELWLVDFKTDVFPGGELADKVRAYEPQLKMYARALQRIYRRPVTECWIYFLSRQANVRISPG